jgi:Eukaryotic translation initiation factor 4G1
LQNEAAQVVAEEALDTVESPIEDFKEPEEGEVVENGKIVETQVNGDSISKAPKEVLRIDTSSMPPPLEIPRRRPGPLDIGAAKRDLSAAPLSALATARNIERLQDIEYPEGVRSPREDLNKDAKDGKFRYPNHSCSCNLCLISCRYDRDFLMQFMQPCKEKPPNLPPLDILGIEPCGSDVLRYGSWWFRTSSPACKRDTPGRSSKFRRSRDLRQLRRQARCCSGSFRYGSVLHADKQAYWRGTIHDVDDWHAFRCGEHEPCGYAVRSSSYDPDGFSRWSGWAPYG